MSIRTPKTLNDWKNKSIQSQPKSLNSKEKGVKMSTKPIKSYLKLAVDSTKSSANILEDCC